MSKKAVNTAESVEQKKVAAYGKRQRALFSSAKAFLRRANDQGVSAIIVRNELETVAR